MPGSNVMQGPLESNTMKAIHQAKLAKSFQQAHDALCINTNYARQSSNNISLDDQITEFQIASEISMQPIIPKAKITSIPRQMVNRAASIRPPLVVAEESTDQTEQTFDDKKERQKA